MKHPRVLSHDVLGQTLDNRNKTETKEMCLKPMKNVAATVALGMIVIMAGNRALAQAPVIESLSLNGRLIVKDLLPGSVAVVEWASSVNGPWKSSWSDLNGVQVDTEGKIRVDVPMFYRVRGEPNKIEPDGMVWIPPGTFTMGSPASEAGRKTNEGPQTQVTLTDGFWMGKFEVTQRDYIAVMASNPSRFQPPEFSENLDRPVDSVGWYDAVTYCEKLTQQERAAGRLPAGYRYQLPTEAQWEYACRAGTTTRLSYGHDPGYAQLENYAWFGLNSDSKTHPVGEKRPNPWGLYDMHGNLYEWCQDWISSSYPGGSVTDPSGPLTGLERVARGGGWGSLARCRSAYRHHNFPEDQSGFLSIYIGFRVVLVADHP